MRRVARWARQAGLVRNLWWSRGGSGPLRATVILTERCHLRCTFCRLWEEPRSGVSAEEWLRFFAANPSLRWVNLSGGEVLAQEGIEELLRELPHQLPRLALLDFPTAGQTPSRTERVVREVLRNARFEFVVTVSVDGDEAYHDRERGIAGSFERAIETYVRLREVRSSGFAVRLGCTLTRAADQQVEGLRRELAARIPDFGPHELHFNLAHHSSHYYRNPDFAGLPEGDALAVLEAQRFRPDPIGWVEWIYARLARRSLAERHPAVGCESLRHTVFVGPDLTVYPCSIWDRPLGNAREHGYRLAPLTTSAASRTVREEIRQRACPGCFTPCEALPAILSHPLRSTLRALREATP